MASRCYYNGLIEASGSTRLAWLRPADDLGYFPANTSPAISAAASSCMAGMACE